MDFLQSLLDSSSVPAITAFILGILTAVSPCPLATNITAIGFISKDIENRHRIFINGLLYTFGRIVTMKQSRHLVPAAFPVIHWNI